MILTPEMLARFAGGRLVLTNELEGYSCEGQIAGISIEYGVLVKVHCSLVTETHSGLIHRISVKYESILRFTVDFFFVQDLGNESIELWCPYTSESARFFRAN